MSTGWLTSAIDRFLSSDFAKGKLVKYWYRYVNKTIGQDAVCFLNYGYDKADADRIQLAQSDEINRIYIQLYHAVASAVDLGGLDVLEMSCGRGGGARYVADYFEPRLMVGVDRTESAVSFCRKFHENDALEFVCGDALCFPFAACSFDVVLNVEASHCYPDVSRFLSEVRRILKPGGHFLYTDFRNEADCHRWREQLVTSGLELVQEEDITASVVRGLELNDQQTRELIRKLVRWPLRGVFRQFAGTTGSMMHRAFKSRRVQYFRYVLQKTAEA